MEKDLVEAGELMTCEERSARSRGDAAAAARELPELDSSAQQSCSEWAGIRGGIAAGIWEGEGNGKDSFVRIGGIIVV